MQSWMGWIRRVGAPLSLGTLVLILAPPAWAQVDEIVVTARKTEESLQDVPISITAFGQEAIERKGINDITKVAQFSPSLQFDESFSQSDTRITIRGLAPTRGRQNVALLVDGIDVSSEAVTSSGGSLLVNSRLLDIERIEVIKGPQEALYGRAAFNGAIQYVTKKPADQFEFDFDVDANNQDQGSFNAGMSMPIFEEKLGIRLNASMWNEDGYYQNNLTGDTVGGDEGWGLALSTRSEFNNGLTINLRGEYNHDEGKPSPQVYLPFNTVATVPEQAKAWYLSDPNDPNSEILPGANLSQCWDGSLLPGQVPPPGYNPDLIGAISAQAQTPNDRTLVERARRIISPELATQLGFPADPSTATDAEYAAVIAAHPFLSPYCEYQAFSFNGALPNGDDLSQPNLGTDPNAPGEDYDGYDRDYWRIALTSELVTDRGTFNFWGGYLYNENSEQQDSNAFGVPSTNIYRDANVNSFSLYNYTETAQTSLELRYATQSEGPLNLALGVQYWNEKVDNKSRSITAQGSGSHFTWSDVSGQCFGLTGNIMNDCPGYTETSIQAYQQAAYPYRPNSPANRNTDHQSFYGVVDWQLDEAWTLTFEGRYSEEEVKVEGPIFYDPDASGGPGSLNPCGIFFRPCEPFDDWIANGNFFADQFDAQDPVDGPTLIQNIPELCWQQDPEGVQRSIDYGPIDDVNGDGEPDGIDTYNPWCVDTLKKREAYFLPKITLDVVPMEGVLVYASWAKSRKPGGFSLVTVGSSGLDRELTEFEPEKMTVWELGANSEWFDSTLRLNGSLFFQDFQDKQALTSTLNRQGDRLVSKIENAAKAEVWGAEIAITWAPIREFIGGNWTLNGGYQWLNSEYTDFPLGSTSNTTVAITGNCTPEPPAALQVPGAVPAGIIPPESGRCIVDYSGNDLENAPDGSFVGQVRYSRPVQSDMEFFIETDAQWTDKRYSDLTNEYWTDDFWNVDFRLGFQTDTWEVLGYVENVFDDDTVQSAGAGPGLGCCFVLGSTLDFPTQRVPTSAVMVDLPLYKTAFLPPPRIIGVRAAFRFGRE